MVQGGFQSEMTRREAAQILGVRESAAEVSLPVHVTKNHVLGRRDRALQNTCAASCAHASSHVHQLWCQTLCRQCHSKMLVPWPQERVKDAHRRLMVANHPDAGGSSFIAAKVNEAKDMLLGNSRRAGSAF